MGFVSAKDFFASLASDERVFFLVRHGERNHITPNDPDFGARPVKRAIQQYLLNDLSKKLLADEVNREKPIIVDSFGDGLVFRN